MQSTEWNWNTANFSFILSAVLELFQLTWREEFQSVPYIACNFSEEEEEKFQYGFRFVVSMLEEEITSVFLIDNCNFCEKSKSYLYVQNKQQEICSLKSEIRRIQISIRN